MVGYGFVRSTGGGATLAGRTRGSAVAASATTSTAAPPEAPPAIPESADARKAQLDKLYNEIEELKGRNKEVWKAIQNIMESAASAADEEQQRQEAERSASLATVTVSMSRDDDDQAGGVADSAAALIAKVNSLAAAAGTAPAAAAATATVTVAQPPAGSAASEDGGIPMRPSGGASRLGSPLSSMDILYGTVPPERAGGASSRSGPWVDSSAATTTVAAAAAAAVAPAVPAAPAQPGSGSPPDSSRVQPEKEGSPSSRAPLLPSPSSASGSPSLQDPSLAAWAGAAVEEAIRRSPSAGGGSPASSPSSPARSSSPGGSPGSRAVRELVSVFDNTAAEVAPQSLSPSPPGSPAKEPSPQAEVMRPSMRPTRRASASRQPRTYRAIPQTPTRSHPSFDVPEGALSPANYLKEVDARTADGKFHPSFAGASVLAAAAPLAAPPAPAVPSAAPVAAAAVELPAPVVVPAVEEEPEAPLEPVAPPEAESVTIAAPVPEATAALAAATVAAPEALLEAPQAPPAPPAPIEASPLAAAEAEPVPEPSQPQPQYAWYNPFTWFTQRSDPALAQDSSVVRSHPSFDPSLAVVEDSVSAAAAAPALAPATLEAPPAPPVEAVAAEPLITLESVVRVAEEQVDDGVGAAAAESAAAWSEALVEGAKPGDFGPVERVAELLEVAMATEEFADAKYDPLRSDLQPGAAGPSAAHKYDLLRGLERTGKDVVAAEAETAATVVREDQRPVYKYDLLYDLLQSVRTSGDPAAILASSDPKYDPVWSLLNLNAATRGSVSKYDMVGGLLKAALAASPQPSRYDPLQLILQAQPVAGSHKYCLAEVVLQGGWQQPLEAGLGSLPSWDPMEALVGSQARSRAAAAVQQRRRRVNKYDMVGQALEAAASLPEELASGRWAAAKPRDLLLKPRGRTEAPRVRRPRSKYDMVGQALDAAASLPDELASGRWAATQGRELLIDTADRTISEGGWGFVRRIRNGGILAVKAVSAAANAGGNLVAKVAGLPYEIVPGVLMKIDRPSGSSPGGTGGGPTEALSAAVAAVVGEAPVPAPAAEVASGSEPSAAVVDERSPSPSAAGEGQDEQPTLLFQFKNAEGSSTLKEKRSGSRWGVSPGGQVTVTGKRKGRGAQPPTRSVAPEQAAAAAVLASNGVPQAAAGPRLERAVVPPLRQAGRRITAAQQALAATPLALPYVDNAALVAALVDAEVAVAEAEDAPSPKALAHAVEPVAAAEATVSPAAEVAPGTEVASSAEALHVMAEAVAEVLAPVAAVKAEGPAAVETPATAAPPAPTIPAAAAALEVPAAATRSPSPGAGRLTPAEMAMDLLVVMSIQGPRSASRRPSLDSLVERFGPDFAAVTSELAALRADVGLMGRHPAVEPLLVAASVADRGDGTGMWSHLYDMLGSVREAEAELPGFLEAVRVPYPGVHALLAAGDAAQGVSILCTLCNLVPDKGPGGAQ